MCLRYAASPFMRDSPRVPAEAALAGDGEEREVEQRGADVGRQCLGAVAEALGGDDGGQHREVVEEVDGQDRLDAIVTGSGDPLASRSRSSRRVERHMSTLMSHSTAARIAAAMISPTRGNNTIARGAGRPRVSLSVAASEILCASLVGFAIAAAAHGHRHGPCTPGPSGRRAGQAPRLNVCRTALRADEGDRAHSWTTVFLRVRLRALRASAIAFGLQGVSPQCFHPCASVPHPWLN